MAGQTLSRHHFSRTILFWLWLVVAFGLALGPAVPPTPSQLSRQCATLAAPTAALELVATPTQKSKSVQPLSEGFVALPASGIFIASSRSASPGSFREDDPSLLPPAAWQSPALPRPPPSS